MTNTIFSHRPITGVSIGVRNVDGHLYIAIAIVNDGTSLNGIMNKDRRDTFCRATARSIINGRIDTCVNKGQWSDDNLTHVILNDVNPRRFIAEFRKVFKPVVDESDDFLCNVIDFPSGTVRGRNVSTILQRMQELANTVATQVLEEAEA